MNIVVLNFAILFFFFFGCVSVVSGIVNVELLLKLLTCLL